MKKQKMLRVIINGVENIMQPREAEKFLKDLRSNYVKHPYFYKLKELQAAEFDKKHNWRKEYVYINKLARNVEKYEKIRAEYFKLNPAGLTKPAPLQIFIEHIS